MVRDKQDRLLMKVKRTTNRVYKIEINESEHVCLLTKIEEVTWL